MATTEATRTKYQMPSPDARIAMISLSAARRLSPSKIPTSTAIGMVTLKVLGRLKTKISAIFSKLELFRTTASRMWFKSRMNRMNVNTAQPMRVYERISPRM
jgi:hypothetical protein